MKDSDGGAAVKTTTSNGPPTAEKVPVPVTPAKVPLAPAPSNGGKDSPKLDRKLVSSSVCAKNKHAQDLNKYVGRRGLEMNGFTLTQ